MGRTVQKPTTLAARSLSRLALAALVAGMPLLGVIPAQAGVTPGQKCQAAKSKSAGQYLACRQNAEAKLAASGDTTTYGTARNRCVTKFNATWQKAEVAAAKKNAACPSAGDQAAILGVLDETATNVTKGLGGGPLLVSCAANLATCNADLDICQGGGNPLGFAPGPSGCMGVMVCPDDLNGSEADPDHAEVKATGLEALGEIDDIAIVGLPDAGAYENDVDRVTATGALLTHAENLKYRIAVVDGPENASLNEIRKFRGKFDSKYGAIYHPWIEIQDPLERPAQGAPPRLLRLPPLGFVAGIYARSDIERGVHKAPANEVIRGLTKFELNINKARQDVLNPEGINALRFFEGRGNRVWGARTMSSDPEWKYVNVRRLFIYIEHSIDKGTQFAVFEPNNPRLWANITQAVEDFLLVLWRDGALLGDLQ
jgi:hypothetical protein